MFLYFFPTSKITLPIGLIESLNLAFADGVFRQLHETVYLLDVDVFNVVALGLESIFQNFGRHGYYV
jgi:hypothetical protein